MKNMRLFGMIVGLIGGGLCIVGGMLCVVIGLAAIYQPGSMLPPGLYGAMGFYFFGKGIFVVGISLNVADRTRIQARKEEVGY